MALAAVAEARQAATAGGEDSVDWGVLKLAAEVKVALFALEEMLAEMLSPNQATLMAS